MQLTRREINNQTWGVLRANNKQKLIKMSAQYLLTMFIVVSYAWIDLECKQRTTPKFT